MSDRLGIHLVDPPPEPDAVGKDAATFIRSYVPIRYIVDGMLPSGSLCGLTGRTGHGKTAFATMLSLALGTGRGEILGRKVRQGRVAYICMENPEDFKMKLAANCYLHASTTAGRTAFGKVLAETSTSSFSQGGFVEATGVADPDGNAAGSVSLTTGVQVKAGADLCFLSNREPNSRAQLYGYLTTN